MKLIYSETQRSINQENRIEMEFFSIGVYNSSEDEFFSKIKDNAIDTFCDIRLRRGVRGAKYAFVNSKRLQFKLDSIGIRYLHEVKLAPTKEIRQLQKEADQSLGEQKRSRTQLGQIFKIAYKDRILNKFDLDEFVDRLQKAGSKRIVLFCVEERPEACHRSLVTEKLTEREFEVKHL